MAHNLHYIWIHLIWTTKNREPLLEKEIRNRLFVHMKEYSVEQNISLDTINGIEDHVHCLVSLQPSMSVSEAVNRLKGESSHWINSVKLIEGQFSWQDGYGAFSVSNHFVGQIRKYIRNQEEHHMQGSYLTDIKEFLKK